MPDLPVGTPVAENDRHDPIFAVFRRVAAVLGLLRGGATGALRGVRRRFRGRADGLRARRAGEARRDGRPVRGLPSPALRRILAIEGPARQRRRRRDPGVFRALAEHAARRPVARRMAEIPRQARPVDGVRRVVSAAGGRGPRAHVLCDPDAQAARRRVGARAGEAFVRLRPDHAGRLRAAVRGADHARRHHARGSDRAVSARHRGRQRAPCADARDRPRRRTIG